MRILYFCSRHFDYQQDLIYAGLVKLLGQESVIDYPWNPKFHINFKPYPKNLGYSGFTIPKPFAPNFNGIDLVILASAKKDALKAYNDVLPRIADKPILFLDGGDLPEIGGDFQRFQLGDFYKEVVRKREFDIVLKREYLTELHQGDSRIHPFPLSFPYNLSIQSTPESEKKYQVSFWGQQNPEIRTNALRLLQDKYDCASNGTTLNQNFNTYKRKGKFYLEEIARCKIVLNFRGGGWDTMRYWEVPATGTFMISQKPQIVIPDNFQEGEQVVWCDDSLTDLIDKIDYFLTHTEEREKIARQSHDHLLKFHLNTHRAKTLLDIVKKMG